MALERIQRKAQVPFHLAGKRLDVVAAELFSEYSRARLQAWISDGQLQVNGQIGKSKDRVMAMAELQLDAEQSLQTVDTPEAMALDIVYEDDSILVLNKPANLVVHPGAGMPDGTLLNGLLHHCPDISSLPRAGIVHRLDKDTTGLMVVAKTLVAHTSLVNQLQARTMGRQYQAVVMGRVARAGKVDAAIGRHPSQRIKMAVVNSGKPAVTHYKPLQLYLAHTHLQLNLETGRTHQIRVHMSHLGNPLVGDSLYQGRIRLPKGIGDELKNTLRDFGRQALHAQSLRLQHPLTEQEMTFSCDLPDDFAQLLNALDEDQNHAAFY